MYNKQIKNKSDSKIKAYAFHSTLIYIRRLKFVNLIFFCLKEFTCIQKNIFLVNFKIFLEPMKTKQKNSYIKMDVIFSKQIRNAVVFPLGKQTEAVSIVNMLCQNFKNYFSGVKIS